MNHIYESQLRNGIQYYVRYLTTDDLDDVLTLQSIGITHLEEKDFLAPLTLKEYEYILRDNGLLLGCFIGDTLIAFRALMHPLTDDMHLGLLSGLKQDELDSVIYQEISVVHPTYRGNRLQQILGTRAMQELDKKYRYVCATVAPMNIPSLLDKLKQNMVITALKQLYGQKWRYIFIKEIDNNKKSTYEDTVSVLMTDYNKQEKLIKQAYVGFQLIKKSNHYYLLYGK